MNPLKLPAQATGMSPARRYGAACLAASLPGWRWMPGMLATTGYRTLRNKDGLTWGVCQDEQTDQEPWPFAEDWLPDPDDPATAGCLLLMLSVAGISMHLDSDDGSARVEWWHPDDLEGDPLVFEAPTIGRVCIMVAAHIGRWPGGEA